MYEFVENNVFNHLKSCLLITKHYFGKESPTEIKRNQQKQSMSPTLTG